MPTLNAAAVRHTVSYYEPQATLRHPQRPRGVHSRGLETLALSRMQVVARMERRPLLRMRLLPGRRPAQATRPLSRRGILSGCAPDCLTAAKAAPVYGSARKPPAFFASQVDRT